LTTESPSFSLPPSADIFLRPSDEARLKHLVNAIAEDSSSVALVSESDALLDHYGRILADALRYTAKLAVEIYSPDSTDALIDRFNRILASMSVSEALKPQGSTAPARLLLVYDGRATGIREMQLLARLLKDFPGANTRVALLLHTHPEAGKKVEAFGRRMIRWDVLGPTADEAKALRERAHAEGQLPEAEALLAYIGSQDEASRTLQETLQVLARADEALADPTPSEASGAAGAPAAANNGLASASSKASVLAAETTLAALSARSAALREEPVFQERSTAAARMAVDPAIAAAALSAAQPKKRMPTILWVGLAALAASALLTLWQHMADDTSKRPELTSAQNKSLEPAPEPSGSGASLPGAPGTAMPGPAGADEPSPAAQDTNGSAQGAATAPSGSAATKGLVGPLPVPEDSDPASRLAAKTAPAAAPVTVAPAPAPVAAAPAPAPAPAPRATTTAPTATPQPAPPPTARPDTPPSAAQAPAGNAPTEIKSIPAGFYVQHMSSGEREVVEAFWRRNPSLRLARLVELTRIGAEGPNFILVSGPFPTITQARTFMNRPGLPKDMWVREASKIRPLLPNSQ